MAGHSRALSRYSIRFAVALAALSCAGADVYAQQFDGYVSLLTDAFPRVGAAELRPRVFGDYRRDIGSRLQLTASGFLEALVRHRGDSGVTRDAIVRPHELSVEARWAHGDLRAGFSRVVWGRLDEFLPTDVVNPQDLTRFFLEGRAEGRMPVGMVRARWLPSDTFAIESIYVPVFRAGRFDQVDESTAPFNIGPGPAVQAPRREPAHTFRNAQGGVRASATTRRVDWSVSGYRGFEPLPLYQVAGAVERPPRQLQSAFPRFTMIGGDFETVRGLWGVRGEVAVFVERSFQDLLSSRIVKGHAVEAGLGVDRKAGNYRFSGNAVVTTRRLSTAPEPLGGEGFGPAERSAGRADRTDLTLVVSIDRSFARETRSIRAFGVYNPEEESAFGRVIGTVSLRDNLSLEGSAGVFGGSGTDVFARLVDRDFVYARIKVFF